MSRSILDERKGPSSFPPEESAAALTPRQKVVLIRIARGLTDQANAAELHISLNTVRFHKKRLYHLLGVDNAVAAVVQALKYQLLSLDEI